MRRGERMCVLYLDHVVVLQHRNGTVARKGRLQQRAARHRILIHHLLDELGQPAIEYLLFQRKHEYFAHLQPTSFDDDVATLQARLPGGRLLLPCVC